MRRLAIISLLALGCEDDDGNKGAYLAEAKNASGATETKYPSDKKLISDNQINLIRVRIDRNKDTEKALLKYLEVSSLSEITRDRMDHILNKIREKMESNGNSRNAQDSRANGETDTQD